LKQSTTKNGCNPEFNETFTFEDVTDLNDVILHVKIMDSDIGLDDHLGHCEVKLEYESLTSTPKAVTAVVDPKKFRFFAEEATIHMEISYQE
jgi:Ca2+-dependent lipid-binding protein